MSKIQRVLVVGESGGGKSALSNVVTDSNDFQEGPFAVSQTNANQKKRFQIDGNTYEIIDTVGMTDTCKTKEEVLKNLEEAFVMVKDGLCRLLFVIRGRFTVEKRKSFQMIISLFSAEILFHTTVIRTHFPDFQNETSRQKDIEEITKIEPKLKGVKMIHVNHQTPEEDPTGQLRKECRMRLLLHLKGCTETYIPPNSNTLSERISKLNEDDTDNIKRKQEEARRRVERERIRHEELQRETERLQRERDRIERGRNKGSCSRCGYSLENQKQISISIDSTYVYIECNNCRFSNPFTQAECNQYHLGISFS